MRDVELYRHLLGLEALARHSVELSRDEGKVDVWAAHSRKVGWPCPECGRELSTYFYPHHITSAAAEALNGRIQAIKSMAVVSATGNTSRPRSIFTVAALQFPDEPILWLCFAVCETNAARHYWSSASWRPSSSFSFSAPQTCRGSSSTAP